MDSTHCLLGNTSSQKGGAKGNRIYQAFDSLMKVPATGRRLYRLQFSTADCKKPLEEWLLEWAADSRPEIRAIITRALNTDKEDQVNRSEIFMILRLDIEDPRWQEAIRVTGSKK